MSLFKDSYSALICNNPNDKVALTIELLKYLEKDLGSKFEIKKIPSPGRPIKPRLVSFNGSPKRDKSDLGMIKNIHAICHIEFNAINLALDAIYRFQEMPHQYYLDWIKVASEESHHFSLLKNYLEELGHHYGDFDAHNGLWQMSVDKPIPILN